MSQLSPLSVAQEHLLIRVFPNLRTTLRDRDGNHLKNKVAISVFGDWLGKENLHLLDCTSALERRERNVRMMCLWEKIFDLTEVYTYLISSSEVILVQYMSRQKYLEDCAYRDNKTSEQFQTVVLPEFQAIYCEHWDDTNVLWFRSSEKVQPLLEQVSICGLYVIEYNK